MRHKKHPSTAIIALMFLAVGTFVLFLERDPGVKKLSVAQVTDLLARDSSTVLIDVRTPEEWNSETGHLLNALSIPLSDLPAQLPVLEQYRSRPLVLYCRAGSRSGKATRLLMDHGFNAMNMAGGIRQWSAAGHPVIREDHR
jgi:rhodanese-related sulfurtransferase